VHDAAHALRDQVEAAADQPMMRIKASRSATCVRPAADIVWRDALRRALIKSSCQCPHLTRGDLGLRPTNGTKGGLQTFATVAKWLSNEALQVRSCEALHAC
jgi:hypothetical protein